MVHIGNDWDDLLQDAIQSESYQHLRQFLIQEYRTHTIYPNMYDIFNAFKYTPYADVKVVILGQDPYHNPNQAHGLSFSVHKGVTPPPSLVNIFKELRDDTGIDNLGKHGDLTERQRITAPQHLVLTAAHPSPLSAYNGFFGCRHFSKTNAFLIEHGIEPVDWRIDPA